MAPRPTIKSRGTPTTDSFANLQMRLGYSRLADGTPLNNISGGYYQLNPVTRLRIVLDFTYRGSWLARRVVDAFPEDMTREGVDFESSLPPDVHEALQQDLVEKQIWSMLCKTLKWGRLYGGALAFIMIDGQDPSTPLDIESVQKGQFKGLFVLDRWMVQPSLQDPVRTLGPELGLPTYYFVNTDANGIPMMTIHYTRVIRVEGDDIPYYQKQSENMWTCSVLEALWDRLIAFDSVSMGTAQLVFKAHLRTYKLKNFREIVAEGGAVYEQMLQMLSSIRMLQSNEGLSVIDQDDELEYNSYTFSGLSDIMLQFAQQCSGSAKIPLIKLFSQSPTGLNSTGDVDLRMYYDDCRNRQELTLRPGMVRLFPVMIKSLTGKMPPAGFRFKFKPLWQLTDKEKSEVSKSDTDDVLAVKESGIISDKTALMELRERGEVTGRWQSITDDMIDEASDDIGPPAPDPNMLGHNGGPPLEGEPDGGKSAVNKPGEEPQVAPVAPNKQTPAGDPDKGKKTPPGEPTNRKPAQKSGTV